MCKQKDKILEFLSKEEPEGYDFKLEMRNYYDYSKYNDGVRFNGLLNKIKEQIDDEEEDLVSRWFAYRTLEKETKETNGYRMFDCDNSNDTCELSRLIYYYLWGWEKGKNDFGKLLILQEENNEIINTFGGDTMNSLGTTLMKYMCKKSVKYCRDAWDDWNKADSVVKHLNNFARYTSCIGNFVLVPEGFNGYRGTHSCIKDYWDLSLDYLAYREKNAWLPIDTKSMKQKAAKENNAFVKYINLFFLWDYVDENYEVEPLFKSHKEKLGGAKKCSAENVYPKESEKYNEFSSYFENAKTYIERRGKFMAAMLKIAYGFKDVGIEYTNKAAWKDWEVSDIYKYIVEKLFLTEIRSTQVIKELLRL